ncbi:tetratricopeptide repeat protein [Tistrella bauzanensis]
MPEAWQEGDGTATAGGRGEGMAVPPAQAEMIRGMVEGLAARLSDAPEDPEGWLRLARSYAVLGDPAASRAALVRGAEANPRVMDIQLALMQARLEPADDAAMDPRIPAAARDARKRALDMAPDHEMALWLGGQVHLRDGEPAAAGIFGSACWTACRPTAPTGPPSSGSYRHCRHRSHRAIEDDRRLMTARPIGRFPYAAGAVIILS